MRILSIHLIFHGLNLEEEEEEQEERKKTTVKVNYNSLNCS